MKNEALYARPIAEQALSPSERGTSMVEMMVAMCILSLIVLSLCQLYRFAYSDWLDGSQEEQIEQQMDTVMGYMERDIKQAEYSPKFNESVDVASGSEVVIYEDVNNDGKLEQVYYQLNGSALQRSVVAPNADGTYNSPTQWLTLLKGVCASPPIFTSGQLTNGHPNLSIGIQLTVQNPTKLTEPLVLSTTYAIRGNTALQEANQI